MQLLRDLGIGAAAERLYLRLLGDGVSHGPDPAGREGPSAARPGATAAAAAEGADAQDAEGQDADAQDVRGENSPAQDADTEDLAVAELVAAGLAARGDDGRLVACPPQLALESLARDHTRRAAQARASAEMLSQLWDSRGARRPYLETLPSYDAAWTVLSRVQSDAVHRVRAITQGNLSSSGQRSSTMVRFIGTTGVTRASSPAATHCCTRRSATGSWRICVL